MQPTTIQFTKLRPDAVAPKRNYDDDAGFDLTAVEIKKYGEDVLVFHTGIAIAIPPGWEGQGRPRSSNRNNSLLLCNSTCTIDAGYHGEIMFSYKIVGAGEIPKVGDRIGQIVFHRLPSVTLEEVSELPPSERGTKGFGSSGK